MEHLVIVIMIMIWVCGYMDDIYEEVKYGIVAE